MAANPKEVGRQIGQMIVEARDKERATSEQRVAEATPVFEVPPSNVTIDVDGVVGAISSIQFDTADIVAVIAGISETVAQISIPEPDFKGIEKAIKANSPTKPAADVIKALNAHTANIVDAQASIGGAVVDAIGQTSAALAKAVESIAATVDAQSERLGALEQGQASVVKAMYARRELILDDDGMPIAVEVATPGQNLN